MRWKVMFLGGLALACCAPGDEGPDGSTDATGGDNGALICTPGQQISCPCPGGSPDGVQVCLPDGSGLGGCSCAAGSGGNPSGGAPATGGNSPGTGGDAAGGGDPGLSTDRCDWIPECEGEEYGCTVTYHTTCGTVRQGVFFCGRDETVDAWRFWGQTFDDGTSFVCPELHDCSTVIQDAGSYCANLGDAGD